MRQSRIYTSQPLQAGQTVELAGPACHYLTRVLRLSKGNPTGSFQRRWQELFGGNLRNSVSARSGEAFRRQGFRQRISLENNIGTGNLPG